MRIVHITHQFLPETHGGVEGSVFDLARAQAAFGDEPVVLSGTMAPAAAPQCVQGEYQGLPVWRFHRADLYFDSWDKGYCPAISRLVREALDVIRPDVVHIHHWIRLSNDLVDVSRSAGIAVVASLHDFALSCPRCFRMRSPEDVPCSRPLSVESCLACVPRRPWHDDQDVARSIQVFLANSKHELSLCHRVITATTMLRDTLRDTVQVPVGHFRVLPLPYTPRFGSSVRVSDTETIRLAFWGSITARKGVDLLIDAFRGVIRNRPLGRPPVELHLFGKIDEVSRETDLRSRASSLPIFFHGRFEYADLSQVGIQMAVFPSTCLETYGLVLEEAFDLGVPVVVPDQGAMATRLSGGGRTFKIGDVADLERVLIECLQPGVLADLRRLVPKPDITPESYARAVRSVYAEAIDTATPDTHPSVLDTRRAEDLFDRAESEFRHLIERLGP